MQNCKEQLLNAFKTNLCFLCDIEPNEYNNIVKALTVSLSDFTVDKMTTEVSIVEEESEMLLQMFGASLLTEGKSKKTVKAYCTLLMRVRNDLGKPLKSLDPFDIRLWLAKRQQSCSLRTCSNYRAYISSFYTWLTAEKIIDKSPMLPIKAISYNKGIKIPFSKDEIKRLRSACSGNIEHLAIFEILLSSGIRISECVALNIKDINFETNKITVREGKGNKSRITFMNDVASSCVREYLSSRTDSDEALFISKRKIRYSDSGIRKLLHTRAKSVDVENVHPHRFRRTFATTMYELGMDIVTLQMLMGHSDINTTKMYISLNETHLREEYVKYN